MDTETVPGTKRRPIYKRRKFWIAVAAAAIVAAGVASYFFTKGFSVSPAGDVKLQELDVDTDPGDATVIIDGKERKERTDTKFKIKVGKHEVKLRLAGYDEATIQIELFETHPGEIQHRFAKSGQVPVKTEEFKTYTNNKYGYRLKYPGTWTVKEESPESVNFANPVKKQDEHGEEAFALTVLVQPNPANQDPKTWYQARPEYAQEDQSQIKTRELTVNSLPGFQWDTPYGFVPYLNTVVTGKGSAFILQQPAKSQDRAAYDEILKTFTLL